MQHIKKLVIYGGILLYAFVMLGLVDENRRSVPCKDVRVIIADSVQNRFVDESDIWQIMQNNNMNIKGVPLSAINTKQLEHQLSAHPAVKVAQAFKTIEGLLNIYIDQRDPILRIYTNNYSFYLDREGNFIPLSEKYAAHVPIASGYIHEGTYWQEYQNVNNLLKDKDLHHDYNLLADLYLLAKYIWEDAFWRSMIEQVYVNENQEFELVPRVGSQLILFGEFKRVEEKFRNLNVLYRKGFSKVGWNSYKTINLKYRNQIVCTKNM